MYYVTHDKMYYVTHGRMYYVTHGREKNKSESKLMSIKNLSFKLYWANPK